MSDPDLGSPFATGRRASGPGVRVVFRGIGDTAAPQEELGTAQRRHLVELWDALLGAAGATEVVVEPTPLSGSPSDGLPWVTPVGLPQPVQCVGDMIELGGADVAFQPDSAEFVDVAAARAVLSRSPTSRSRAA